MGLTEAWTGRTACALQAALRLSNEAFAHELGISVRAVAAWHNKPGMTPRTERQQLLDTVFERASEPVRARFTALVAEEAVTASAASDSTAAHTLTVAIAVVIDAAHVLVVQRRGEDGAGIAWQFPAGVVKPGVAPETVAVRETLAETGVDCRVTRSLGSRLHPVTHVHCDYLLCEYLAGEVENKDVVENVSVTWAAADRLTRFIPAERVFPPVLEALEVDK